MLALRDISLQVREGTECRSLIHDLSTQIPEGHLCGIIGPSCAGKTTLLEGIAGLRALSSGKITWDQRPVAPREVCLITSKDAACERLTVRETIEAAFHLRAAGTDAKPRREELDTMLATAGLEEAANEALQHLDLARTKRTVLAAALTGSPPVLLCDEFTDHLEPLEEIGLLKTLRQLAEKEHHLVIVATQSMRHLLLYDSVMVLYGGMVAYHGPNPLLLHYFNLDHAEDLFPTLAGRSPGDWYRSWLKHRAPYGERVAAANARMKSEQARIGELFTEFRKPGLLLKDSTVLREAPLTPSELPGILVQARVLAARRWQELSRNGLETGCWIALSIAAPAFIAWLFKHSSAPRAEWLAGLLLVIGSANGAREFAQRHAVLQTEMRAGVRPIAVLLSTLIFLAPVVVAQAVWTAVITREFGATGATTLMESLWFAAGIAAMSSVALAISSFARTADRAALCATYFVVVEALIYFAIGDSSWTLFGAVTQGIASVGGAFDLRMMAFALGVIKLHLVIGLLAAWAGLAQERV